MTSQNQYSDEEIRLYLLGNLARERREQLEVHLLSDPTIHDELVAAEDDLVDDYLTKKLNDQESHQFETDFTITAERRDKVQFGRTFRQYLDSRQIADPQEDPRGDFAESPLPLTLPPTESLIFGRRPMMPVMTATLGLLLFLVVVAAGWLAFNRTAVPKTSRPTIAVTLRPGTTRASGDSIQKIGMPPANADVGFKLELGRSVYRNYRAELLRENESLAAFESLEAKAIDNHFEVEVIIDASLFEEDDYRLKLSGVSDSGELVPTEEYGFRVSR